MLRRFLLSLSLVCLIADGAFALPFNTDMVNNQLKPGSISRSKPKGSIAIGAAANYLEKKEDAQNLTNPKKGDTNSAATGRRLFAVNCSPCHGDIAKKPWKPGPVISPTKFAAPPPDITIDFYKEKSDGFFYGTIHFGGVAMMPPYGWKLSPDEHWDIINYIRMAQGQ